MYKIKAKKGVQILVSDLNMIICDSHYVEIDEEQYKKSNDLKKIEKYLVFEKIVKEEISEIKKDEEIESELEKQEDLSNKIYIKNLDDINDDIVVEEQVQYEKFIMDHNLDIININNIEEKSKEEVEVKKELENEDIEANIKNEEIKEEVKEEAKEEIKEEAEEEIKEKPVKKVKKEVKEKKQNKEDGEIKKPAKRGPKPKQNKKSQDDDIK